MEMLEKEKPILAGVCPIIYRIGKVTCKILRKGINCIRCAEICIKTRESADKGFETIL
jgi:hypothetical protein